MILDGVEHWSVTIEVPETAAPFNYRYFVRRDDGSCKDEWGRGNTFAGTDAGEVDIYDRWQDQPFDKPFYSAAFTECIFRHSDTDKAVVPAAGYITICVTAPMIGEGRKVAICGETESLGAWDPAKAPVLSHADFPLWKVNIPAEEIQAGTQFKFLVIDDKGNVEVWEGGENRTFGITPLADGATVLTGMRFINTLDLWKGAGTAIPVFSLRTEADFGVGDFYDLIPMVDWAKATGQSVLQLLPINDTTMTHTWTDSYPYNANSTFALHPMFLRLEEVGELADAKRMKHYRDLAAELNALPEIDYERVNNGKIEYLREHARIRQVGRIRRILAQGPQESAQGAGC